MSVTIFAPISIGNLSVGFDSLGLAVAPIDGTLIGDTVTVEACSFDQFILTGTNTDNLPADDKNIVWQAVLLFNQNLLSVGLNPKPIKVSLHKNIPVCSGLGSSGCSVVASVVALNEFYQNPFTNDQLLVLMGQLEAKISGSLHYDNVAPSFLGGLQLMSASAEPVTRTIPFFSELFWVIAYPDVVVSTKAAREILPVHYPRSTVIEFGQRLANFIDACHRNDAKIAMSLIKDCIAEPYREQLIPHYTTSRTKLVGMGALAAGISGSGPTLFAAFDDREKAQQAQDWLNKNYLQSTDGFTALCKVDNLGARPVELRE